MCGEAQLRAMLSGFELGCKQVLWFGSKHRVVTHWKDTASISWIQGNRYLFSEVFSGLIGWKWGNSMALYSWELGAGKATHMQCGPRQFTLLYIYFSSHLFFSFFFQLLNVSSLEYSFSLGVWCRPWQYLCRDAATTATTTTTKILVPHCDAGFWHQIIFSWDFSFLFFSIFPLFFFFLPATSLNFNPFFFPPWYKREMLMWARGICI